MIRRELTWGGVLLLLACTGCTFNSSISADTLNSVPPMPAKSLDGTYADRSPDWMGGSIWEQLTGEYPEASGDVQTCIRALPDKRLALTRLVNGVATGRRIVPYWIEHGYVKVSRSKWWTTLLASDVVRDESALSRRGNDLMVYHEYGYVFFITLLPVPAETGPPLGWQQHPSAAALKATTRPQSETNVSSARSAFSAPSTKPVDEAALAKAAAMAFFDAVAKGDAKAAQQVSIAGPAELRWIEAFAAVGKAQAELFAAAAKGFGQAEAARHFGKPGERTAKSLNRAAVEVKGKRASIAWDPDGLLFLPQGKLKLSMTDGGWKLDWPGTFRSPSDADGMAHVLNFVAEQDRAIARKIDAGQYKTAEEAALYRERAVKTGALRMLYASPTTKASN